MKIPKKEKTEVKSIRLPIKLWQHIGKLSEKSDRSANWLIMRKLCELYKEKP